MSDNKNIQVNISGISPAKSGEDPKYGNWFLIDQSGEFSLDHSVTATIWLVGGGCDGTGGVWNGNRIYCEKNEDGTIKKDENGNDIWYPEINTWYGFPNRESGISLSGSGGDGGYVFTAMEVKIPKNKTLTSVIAETNNKNGTSLNIDGTIYKCNQEGYISTIGGKGGKVPPPPEDVKYVEQDEIILSTGGENGVDTPYGYVGSSGGGGAACNGATNADNGIDGGIGAGNGLNHRSAGSDATNYGCGGGGGAVCGQVAKGFDGGSGKQGCIIISYIIDPTQNTLVVQKHYKRVCNTHKTCDTDYYSNNGRKTCCGNVNSCGCGNSSKGSEYIDTIHLGSNNSQ